MREENEKKDGKEEKCTRKRWGGRERYEITRKLIREENQGSRRERLKRGETDKR